MFIRNKSYIFILFLICKVNCQWPGLTFVIDESLSMKDEVKDVWEAVSLIVDIYLENMQFGNISLVIFNDTEATLRITTESPEDLMTSLTSAIPANGDFNYECPESTLAGVKLALQSSPLESYIYVFTDASAKDYKRIREIERLCEEKQSQVVFVLMDDCRRPRSNRFQVYYDIATVSSGLAFRVNKNEIKAVFPAIRETMRDTKVVLAAVTLDVNHTEVPFKIYEDIDYAIVSASGINVSLEISGPSVQKKIMWTNHGKVIKLTGPGEYVANVSSAVVTSVVVTGWTNFYFQYGFSRIKSQQFYNMDREPFAGIPTHLSIYVTDEKYSLAEPVAQILDMQGNVTDSFPLKEIKPNFYITTEPFTAPAEVFKLAIAGKVAGSGKPVRRIAKTPVTPKILPPKIITDELTVYRGLLGDIALRIPCEATGSPKLTFEWKVDGFEVTSGTEYDIVDGALIVKYPKDGDRNYTCTVNSAAGSDSKMFIGVVGDGETLGLGVQYNVYLLKDKSITLNCSLPRTDSSSVKWLINGAEMGDKPYFNVENAEIGDSGNYTCHVSDESGSATETFVVIVGYPPKFKFSQGPDVYWDRDMVEDDLRCDAYSEPLPNAEWKFNGKPLVGASGTQLNINEWGHYWCNVSNAFGAVQRDFYVKHAGKAYYLFKTDTQDWHY